MKLSPSRTLERLSAEEQCFGALFCSYTFDPTFFEEQVLRVVLRLASDPVEQATRYHDEARRALQETPVVCVVDASVRKPGHRLPYDLLEVNQRTFHPKLAVVLYDRSARVLVGSGNLTRPGFGENTELFYSEDLKYDDPATAATLREIDALVASLPSLVRSNGAQLALFREALARRIAATPTAEATSRSVRFLHSANEALLPQLLSLIEPDARITRLGLLAPFFERDDEDALNGEEIDSTIAEILQARSSKGAAVDLGVLWEDPPLAPGPEPIPKFEEGLGRLWAWLDTDEEPNCVNYLTMEGVTAQQIHWTDSRGASRRSAREDAEKLRADREFWVLPTPSVFAPLRIVSALVKRVSDLSIWLHPARRFEDDVPVHRPLHAKLLLIATTRRGREHTYVLLGSPNASRRALLHGPEAGGNVETAVAFVLEGTYSLPAFAPELIHCKPDIVNFAERVFPQGEINLGLWIETAVHDAAEQTLTVTWASQGPAPLGAWSLLYEGKVLAQGTGAPANPTVLSDFTLLATSCELLLQTGGAEHSVVITVRDLAALPTNPALAGLDLRELLALLGRRIGAERLSTLRATRGPAGMNPVLEGIFGEGFGPTDVFKAWWGVAQDLADPQLSVPAFRLRLEGNLGVGAVWKRLREAAAKEDPMLSRDEAWFYGAELRESLRSVQLPETVDRPAKQVLLLDFLAQLEADLAALAPRSDDRPWVNHILQHYGVSP